MAQVTESTLKFKNKITKGHYGYLKQRKARLLAGALILLLGIAGLVAISLVKFKTTKTWLAIAAAISAIPASMSLATYFTLIKYKSRTREEYEELRKITGNGLLNCELIVPNSEGAAFSFPYIYVHEDGIFALTNSEKIDLHKTENYVRNYLRLNQCDGEFRIYEQFETYRKKLKSLAPSDRNTCGEFLLKQEGILRAISM